jgi:phage replication O-like protein O
MKMPRVPFTQFPNSLLERLSCTRMAPSELQVVNVVIRTTLGFHKEWVRLTHEDFSRFTGISRSNINRTLKSLEEANMLKVHRYGSEGKTRLSYAINVNVDEWHLPVPKNIEIRIVLSKLMAERAFENDGRQTVDKAALADSPADANKAFKETKRTPSNPPEGDLFVVTEYQKNKLERWLRRNGKASLNDVESGSRLWFGFLEFWKMYPKKTGFRTAWEAWWLLQPDPELVQSILQAVRIQINWRQDGTECAPWQNPQGWLIEEGWTNEESQANPKHDICKACGKYHFSSVPCRR